MKDYLYDWVVHYNPYTKNWAAIPRDLYTQYWDNYNLEGDIRSSSHKTRVEILQKTEGVEIEKKLSIE